MTVQASFQVEVHVARNLVYTRYFGTVTSAHMSAGVEKISGLIASLKSGFTVFADLTQLEKMD